jgi:hypothetical protein
VALRENNGTVNPLGLFDLDRNIRKVGAAYKQLIADWRDVLPTQSVCLVVPIATPHEHDNPWTEQLFANVGEVGVHSDHPSVPEGAQS